MADDRKKNLKSIVNASGFVFQLSIMDNVQRTREKHNWDILVPEHPWRNLSSGDEGYIDIILKNRHLRLVIECKRSKDASWVFLNTVDEPDKIYRAKLSWASIYQPGKKIISEYDDFKMEPTSPESGFCAIRGSGEKDNPLLERICGQLLRSIDCLSIEEMEIERKKESALYIYVPVIVTNARLVLCQFDPGKVSLKDGLLSDGKFKTVPFIRFRKSLTTVLSLYASPSNITDANIDKQRTILIINSDCFCDILENIKIEIPPDPLSPWAKIHSILSN